MNDDLDNIQYALIRDHNYSKWFEEEQYKEKNLSDQDKREIVIILNQTVAQYSEGLPLLIKIIKSNKDFDDEYHALYRTVVSVMLFVVITMIDIMVVMKYFVLADNDYDRRFMRGKLSVILNEGFKKLYGFKNHKESEWYRLLTYLKFFPELINSQYQELTNLLEKHAVSSYWWKDERSYETHLIAEELYYSRMEEVIESKVMSDSMKLFRTMLAVDHFLSNVHACILNTLILKYQRGELKEE